MADSLLATRYSLACAALTLVVSLGGCPLDSDPPDGEASPRDVVGRVELVLGDDPDASVVADANALAAAIPPKNVEGVATPVTIEYIGKGTLKDAAEGPRPPAQENRDALPPEDADFTSFVGINVATRNQFRVTMARDEVGALAPVVDSGNSDPDFDPGPGDFDVPDDAEGGEHADVNAGGVAPMADATDQGAVVDGELAGTRGPAKGWANNFDTRQRIYAVNAPVSGVQRWQTRFGASTTGGCSGSLVGPRHVLTAAHCIYSYVAPGVGSFFNKYTLFAGANGTSSLASVFIDQNAIPPGQDLWFWVPSEYIAAGTREHDIGILVTPAVLGGNLPGQAGCFDGQCWFGYMNYTDTETASWNLWRRGYPACGPTFVGTTARIDEPCQTGTWDPNQSCVATPCSPTHLHGVDASCTAGDFIKPDANGENQILHHGCSASAGDSGSPLYHWNPILSDWVVLSVQTSQECGATALCPAMPANELARPMVDTRLTTNYVGWITNFRTLYP